MMAFSHQVDPPSAAEPLPPLESLGVPSLSRQGTQDDHSQWMWVEKHWKDTVDDCQFRGILNITKKKGWFGLPIIRFLCLEGLSGIFYLDYFPVDSRNVSIDH